MQAFREGGKLSVQTFEGHPEATKIYKKLYRSINSALIRIYMEKYISLPGIKMGIVEKV